MITQKHKSLRILSDASAAPSSSQCSVQLEDVKGTLGGEGTDPRNFMGRAALVTLGCAKNQVDSEVMLGVLEKTGFEIVQELGEADVIVVNTCGFLESAIKESIDAILAASEYKTNGRLRKLFVAGCMVERYRGDIVETLPEVDGFLGIDDILKVGEFAQGAVESLVLGGARPYFLYDDTMPRKMSTASHTAYVKISEGCNRPCTFCIIPRIRGGMRSRTPESVLKEVRELVEQGVREINLVGQDLTAYGEDLSTKYPLHLLLSDLNEIDGLRWIRLLYAYPLGVSSELLNAITILPKVCKYLDIPLQHSSEKILRAMQRPLGKYSPRKLVAKIRSEAPTVNIRTTFIVGFPGETMEDVLDLEAFISEGHFSNVGIFTYSPEVGTPSYEFAEHLPQSEKDARRDRLMEAQAAVLESRLQEYVGKSFEILFEGVHEDSDLLFQGRTQFQAPEVDGIVIINDVQSSQELKNGSFHKFEVTEVLGYDLVGQLM
jgi:ribosomal protein S12 methylthiotransferase